MGPKDHYAKLTGTSFIGKTGGEIFHEMMLRKGVKHICWFTFCPLSKKSSLLI